MCNQNFVMSCRKSSTVVIGFAKNQEIIALYKNCFNHLIFNFSTCTPDFYFQLGVKVNGISIEQISRALYLLDSRRDKMMFCVSTFNLLVTGHALGIWICGCRRELWASKSAGFNSTKILKICRCKRWCPKDLCVCAPAAPMLRHSLSDILCLWDNKTITEYADCRVADIIRYSK